MIFKSIYRQIFEIQNDGHVWNALDNKSFLEKLGGYRRDRREEKEGLTLAGLLMFGDGLAIRDEFDNIKHSRHRSLFSFGLNHLRQIYQSCHIKTLNDYSLHPGIA